MAKYDGVDFSGMFQAVFSAEDGLRQMMEYVVNAGMRQEAADYLRAATHERSDTRRGHRNGTKPRRLKTRVGELNLEVPQVRGCEPYHPSLFARWQRSERALLATCGEIYFQGVSTRNVRRVLETMCGCDISATTVSRVAQELDEKLSAFRARRLELDDYPYLHIDARYEKVRVAGRVVSQAVLVVVGFTGTGRREVLSWRVADSESEATWGEIFRDLKDRGLRPADPLDPASAGVRLIVSDAHGGMQAARRRHFQGVAWQRCRVHFKRELGRKVSHRHLPEAMSDLAAVFAPEEREECLRRAEEMASKWMGRYPKVAAMLREGVEDCLTVLSFPENHRRRLRSTNMMENLMKRLKKRTQVVSVFPSRESCDRLIGAQLIEVHETWATERRPYFNMENVTWQASGEPGAVVA